MTRQVVQKYHCNNCGTWQTQESSFSRWVRNNKKLESKDGYCVLDQDFWIHAYKTHGNREYQCLILVEIKTFGRSLTDAQRDTLYMINQLTRNRRQTPTKKLRHQAGTGPMQVRSAMLDRVVSLRAYGCHVLTFSGLGPDDSEWIRWDNTDIDEETLTKILRFDLDPDTLKPMDFRRHHQTHQNKTLSLL